jgi:hypothetical protein
MSRDIKLSGGEITMLKTLGLSGTAISGKMLMERSNAMENAEFLDTLDGLTSMGFVLCSKVNVSKIEDVERASFRVNPSYSRDLKDAMRPTGRKDDDRRRRRRS